MPSHGSGARVSSGSTKGLAIAGLSVSLVALPLGIVAIVLSSVSLYRTSKLRREDYGSDSSVRADDKAQRRKGKRIKKEEREEEDAEATGEKDVGVIALCEECMKRLPECGSLVSKEQRRAELTLERLQDAVADQLVILRQSKEENADNA
eukprot:TRINITY_DN28196_c0_g1_i1.p1 TRINITY_DN28196_c0_g1~~TRINITY_DN28196_c0_g1_i1.p1  ORF type:complete len:150 (+),score=29.71 TRINITY_DN28196_c0_g1_i1:48-497(+)